MRKTKILVFARLPQADTNAGDQRFMAILRLLKKTSDIQFFESGKDPSIEESKNKIYREQLKECVARDYSNKELEKILLLNHFDLIFFEGHFHNLNLMRLCRKYQPGASLVVDSIDVHFARELMRCEIEGKVDNGVEEKKSRELNFYRNADAVIASSDEDRQILLKEGIQEPVFLIPLIVPQMECSQYQNRKEIIFVGNFNHAPNPDGLLWFIEHCWPVIGNAVPDARLTVVGPKMPREVLLLSEKFKNIEIVGNIPQIKPYLDRAGLAIAPLRFGAGMKGKVVEAMAYGLPVVTTPVGVQGIPAVSGKHLLIANNPEEFSNHVVDLLQNPLKGELLGRAARELVKKLYTPEAVQEKVNNILNCLEVQRPFKKMMRNLSASFRGLTPFSCSQ